MKSATPLCSGVSWYIKKNKTTGWFSRLWSVILFPFGALILSVGCQEGYTAWENSNRQQVVKVIWQKAASPLHMEGIPYILQWAAGSPLKIPLSHGDLGLHLIMVSSAHPSPQPKRHLDGSAIFAGLTIMTDRPCYSVCNNRPHLRSYCDAA